MASAWIARRTTKQGETRFGSCSRPEAEKLPNVTRARSERCGRQRSAGTSSPANSPRYGCRTFDPRAPDPVETLDSSLIGGAESRVDVTERTAVNHRVDL